MIHMKRLLLLFGLVLYGVSASSQDLDTSMLQGKWKLKSYDAIENIRLSEAYRTASPQAREGMDRKIDRFIANTFYHFTSTDSVNYTDLSDGSVVQRKATYRVKEGKLLVIHSEGKKEDKKATMLELKPDHLVLSPIGKAGENKGKMVLKRIE